MAKPIQLISIDKDGNCALTEEAEEFISSIEENISVVCVAGLYRTGKSYLLNRLLGRQDGFEIGPTINSCTKGLWIWGEAVDYDNRKILLIDTEGLGSAFDDRNETIDMEIFCLGLLLSSLFIYNSMKNIDEAAIESLSLLLQFANKIQSNYNSLDNYASNFPSFMWVLRDFALELIDSNGKKISPSQYLENALQVKEDTQDLNSTTNSFHNNSEETNKKNEIRKLIKYFFKERDCHTLIRPVYDEKKLRYIDKLPHEELRPEFIAQADEFVKKVFQTVRLKQVQGTYLNGRMYVNLIKTYVNAINSNAIPDVKSSWKIVIDKQFAEAFDKSFNFYVEEMLSLNYNQIQTYEELMESHDKYKEIALDYVSDLTSLNVPLNVCMELYKKIDHKINSQFKDFISRWKEIAFKKCNNLASQLIEEYKSSPELNDMVSSLELIGDVYKLIDTSEINEKKYEIIYPQILQFWVEQLKKGIKENKTNYEKTIKDLMHEKNTLEGIVQKTKEMLERSRETSEKQIRDIKEEMMELRLDFESKIDEKNKIIRNMQMSSERTIEEYQAKLEQMSQFVENKKLNVVEFDKKKSKRSEGMLEYKIDAVLEKIDTIKDFRVKSELDKAKLQAQIEMNTKLDLLEEEFNKKLSNAKKLSEKTLLKYKAASTEEISNLKNIIKDLYDEINDYKNQVTSQDYKIELYREKIIGYENEKKIQIDHAELIKTLTLKFNSLLDKNKK